MIKKASTDTRIFDAREKVNQEFRLYYASPTSNNELLLQEQERSLQEKYNRVQEEEIADMVQKIELARYTSQHKLS